MIKITQIVVLFFLLTSIKINAQHEKPKNKEPLNKCICNIIIDENQNIFINEKIISKNKIYKSIQKLYKKCKRSSEVRIESIHGNSYTDIDFYEEINELVTSAIHDLQNELSLEKYGRSIKEINTSEGYYIINTFPVNIKSEFCCIED
ncbi:hypothetical protein [Aquimarina sp. AU119]|uniref:hypothetical protein n=1 Tax=Aquimarina sp. AU119 TaxID=2108528 RepID=UPI000D6897D8|nr:hypothetical protein [Aquimarina sp. AU119]